MGKNMNDDKLAKNTIGGGKTTIDLKQDTAFLKKSKTYAEIYIKQNKDAVMKKILKASNYEKAKEFVGNNKTTVKGWSDVMRLNILLRLIRKHFKSKNEDSKYVFNLKAQRMADQDKLPDEFKIEKGTADYKKHSLHKLITGVDRLLKQNRAEDAYNIIMGAGEAVTLTSKSDKLKHALGKITHAELEETSRKTSDTNKKLTQMLKELLTQDISEFETTIKRYDKYDSRKFDVARSFLYKLIEKSTDKIILKTQNQFANVFAESNNTDQQMKNLLITIRETVRESEESLPLLTNALNSECFNTFTTSVASLSDRLFTLETDSSIIDCLKQCKKTLDSALNKSTNNEVVNNLKQTLAYLNANVVDHMINLTKTNNLPNGKLTFIPKKLNNINNQSTCGQTLMNYFNSVRTLYAKMKLYYSIDTTLGNALRNTPAYSNVTTGYGSYGDILKLIEVFKNYELNLKAQKYEAVNTFISTLENDIPNPNPGSNGLDALTTCLDNAMKPFKCYDLGSNIADALQCMYEQYEAQKPLISR